MGSTGLGVLRRASLREIATIYSMMVVLKIRIFKFPEKGALWLLEICRAYQEIPYYVTYLDLAYAKGPYSNDHGGRHNLAP